MSFVDSQDLKFEQTARRPKSSSLSSRGLMRLDRKDRAAEAAIEESLSSALLASDVELEQILCEVEQILKGLKSQVPDWL